MSSTHTAMLTQHITGETQEERQQNFKLWRDRALEISRINGFIFKLLPGHPTADEACLYYQPYQITGEANSKEDLQEKWDKAWS